MKKTNKKLLLALGTVATVAAPVAAVVSCGSETGSVRHFNLLPTYTGQADQLIALGIQSDYYPMQLNTKAPFEYLTNSGKFMTEQSDDFKAKFQKSLDYVMPKTKGVSWWNQDAEASDDNRVSNTYWQDQKGSVLLYEHYLLDDDQKIVEQSWAPKHTAKVSAETNFRASRDPYTRLPKGVFFGWDLSNKTLEDIIKNDGNSGLGTPTVLDAKTHKESEYVATEAGVSDKNNEVKLDSTNHHITVSLNQGLTMASGVDSTYKASMSDVVIDADSAKIIKAMRQKRAEFLTDGSGESDWFYNDWFFADSFHRMFLDNKDFQESNFVNWMVDSTETSPFTTSDDRKKAGTLDVDGDIKALFDASTFTGVEVQNSVNPTSRSNTGASSHHPIYEQQEGTLGAAPMFEGAQRDNQLYLFNVAWQVSNLAKWGTPYGEQYYDELDPTKSNGNKTTAGSKAEADAVKQYIQNNVTGAQYEEMTNALKNANTITGQLQERMSALKTYFEDLGVSGRTFGMMTVAPGKGVSTIQSMSKYSFIYKELGFTQPMPSNLDHMAAGAKKFTDGWADSKLASRTVKNDDGTTETIKTNALLKGDAFDTLDGEAKYDSTHATEETVTNAIAKNSLFNMDDNGWFWTLGESGSLNADKLGLFKGQFDMGVIAGRDENYEAEINGNNINKAATQALFKGGQQLGDKSLDKGGVRVNYDLWNEGIKTPFVMHMVLDQIMTVAENYAKTNNVPQKTGADLVAAKKAALNWGSYFTDTFTSDNSEKIIG